MFLNKLWSKVDPILRKNLNVRSDRISYKQTNFRTNYHYWTHPGRYKINSTACRLFQGFWLNISSKIWKKLLEHGIPKEKVDAFMILYYKTPSVVSSSVRNTELLWHNSWRPLSGHIYLALFIFITCLEYVPKMQMKV